MVLFLYLLIICYQAQFLAQHCVLELAQYEAVLPKLRNHHTSWDVNGTVAVTSTIFSSIGVMV